MSQRTNSAQMVLHQSLRSVGPSSDAAAQVGGLAFPSVNHLKPAIYFLPFASGQSVVSTAVMADVIDALFQGRTDTTSYNTHDKTVVPGRYQHATWHLQPLMPPSAKTTAPHSVHRDISSTYPSAVSDQSLQAQTNGKSSQKLNNAPAFPAAPTAVRPSGHPAPT